MRTKVEVPAAGLQTVFFAERFNALVQDQFTDQPHEYELLPRRTPPKES